MESKSDRIVWRMLYIINSLRGEEKWRSQNGGESKYRMERVVMNILNGYVDFPTHRAEKYILELRMMEQ